MRSGPGMKIEMMNENIDDVMLQDGGIMKSC